MQKNWEITSAIYHFKWLILTTKTITTTTNEAHAKAALFGSQSFAQLLKVLTKEVHANGVKQSIFFLVLSSLYWSPKRKLLTRQNSGYITKKFQLLFPKHAGHSVHSNSWITISWSWRRSPPSDTFYEEPKYQKLR